MIVEHMQPRAYHVQVVTPLGRSAYITLADGSCTAVAHAMQHFPSARRISAKPVRTSSAG